MNLDEILRCPRCHGPLAKAEPGYDCHECRLRYPVTDGIASFVPSDARPLGEGTDGGERSSSV